MVLSRSAPGIEGIWFLTDEPKVLFSLLRQCLSRGALSCVQAGPETQRPCHQCSSRSAQRHDRSVPHKYVRGLKIRAMQFKHAHASQAAERACCQSGRDRIQREASPEEQPTQKHCRNGVEEAGEQAYDADGDEVVDLIIAEQECKDRT